jgi:hypothetical protein
MSGSSASSIDDSEIGVTKAEAEVGNKEAAGTTMVTEASWIDYVILYKKDQEALLSRWGWLIHNRSSDPYD